MSFLKNLTAFLSLGKKEETLEYFFAINIGIEEVAAALWMIEGKDLKVLDIASGQYSNLEEIISVIDRLLDQVLGLKEIEPQKILFGVPHSWIHEDNLKEEYLKILRSLVKELELAPMAYVATSNALIHLLEKQEGVPVTAILVGFEDNNITVTVTRAGKVDGVKIVKRGDSVGVDIEKALLTFTEVETLPSKILIYGKEAQSLKSQLLAFPWMSKLSFLHFPKIETLNDGIEIKSICLAGASEKKPDVVFSKEALLAKEKTEIKQEGTIKVNPEKKAVVEDAGNFGFVVGDVAKENHPETDDNKALAGDELEKQGVSEESNIVSDVEDFATETAVTSQSSLEIDDFEKETTPPPVVEVGHKKGINLKKFIPKSFKTLVIPFGAFGLIIIAIIAFVVFLKADVRIFVEPTILEKDAQVIADPNQKSVDEENKIIPGRVIDVEVSGSAKDTASGKKQIGDPAKGTIIIYNKTFESKSLSKGIQISGSGNMKFTLDTSVNIASQSASDSGITFGKANTTVTATSIGADGNLPSGSEFTIAGFSTDKLAAKSEGNFAGGTSKEVTVVSSEDQQRVLALLASDLRKQAQQKLQEQFPDKKVLEEALSESIVKKSYSKNINDQAQEFSLNMTVKFKGTAFDDVDLRTIVSKLVNTQVPDGFLLDLSETETQADVSELKKDGKLVFLARFKAKLIPKIDTDKIKDQIKFKTPEQVTNILKGTDHILGSEITIIPNLPAALVRLPILTKNIRVEVGLK